MQSQSIGTASGSGNTQTVNLCSATVGCGEDIAIYEDTEYHTFVFQEPPANSSCTKITPVISWPTPAAITYGTQLSSTQLDASFSVPGTCVYSPAAGAVPAVGTQTLSVTCTTTDTPDSIAITKTVSLTVKPASPTFYVTVTNPSQTTPLSLGHSETYIVNVSAVDGFTGPVSLSVSGLSQGVTAQLSPASITTSGSTTLTLTTTYSNSTYIGNSTVVVNGTSGGLGNSATFALATQPMQYNGTCGAQ